MANEPKYRWKVGEPLPILDQHSSVKHKIVESYVRNYVLTLMKQALIPKLQLTLVDGFSGGGVYQSEQSGIVDGSPLLMMRAVHEARALLNIAREKEREISVDYEFIDACPDTVAYLNHWLRCRREDGVIQERDFLRANVKHADFIKEIPRLVSAIRQRKLGQRAIFLLDQYNYSDVPMQQIRSILTDLAGAEVILTFNVDSIMTYLSDRDAHRKSFENIGLGKNIPWSQINYFRNFQKHQWRQILQRYLAKDIREASGAQFMTLFFVKPHGSNTWDYWLIHLSKHYKAHEVMKDLHWEFATEFCHELEPGVFLQGYDANRDDEYTGQTPFDFGDKSREACVDGLYEHFGTTLAENKAPVTLGTLIQSCASNSPGSTQHFLDAAKRHHQSKRVVICDADGKVRGVSKRYNLTDTIEFIPQIGLF